MFIIYIQNQLGLLRNDPEGYIAALFKAEAELNRLRKEFDEVWTYCAGCKKYVKVEDACEEIVDFEGVKRKTLRCGVCNTIWKFVWV